MEIEILPWSLRFGSEDCESSEVESQDAFSDCLGILSLVTGYFTFVAGSFCHVAVLLQFALSQPLSHNAKQIRG